MKIETKPEVNLDDEEIKTLEKYMKQVEGVPRDREANKTNLMLYILRLMNKSFELGRHYQDEYFIPPSEVMTGSVK